MPAYNYLCPQNHEFEHHTRDGEPACPVCGDMTAVRIPAPTNFILKGSGWAKDGYSKRGKIDE